MPQNKLIPVTIVTGFLGSGKTTLLTSLIKTRQDRRLALLINEFGEISIDGMLIREASTNQSHVLIHDFPYGLIAYDDDQNFVPTLQAISERRANIDHLLIETSGLALPSAVMEILQSPELENDYILDATLAVVDTPWLLENYLDRQDKSTRATSTLFEQQLEFSDVVVLNKIDELDDEQLLNAEKYIREKAPNVRFMELAYQAKLDIRLALGLKLHQPSETANHLHIVGPLTDTPEKLSPNQQRFDGHVHSGLAPHVHGLTTHKHFHEQDPGWLSFVLQTHDQQQPELLKSALLKIARQEPLLRCKGFFHTDNGFMLAQGVRTRIEISHDHNQQQTAHSELVFIGYHLKRDSVLKILAEITQTIWK